MSEHNLIETYPEGLGPAEFRRHPVTTLLRDAAFHGESGIPTPAELDALDLEPDLRGRVERDCAAVAAIHATGNRAAAWAQADRDAVEVIGALQIDQRDPDYLEPVDDLDALNPDELAARIRR